jgi:hypothetical protein
VMPEYKRHPIRPPFVYFTNQFISLFPWRRTTLTEYFFIRSVQPGPHGGATRGLATYYANIGEFGFFSQYRRPQSFSDKRRRQPQRVLVQCTVCRVDQVVPSGVQHCPQDSPYWMVLILYRMISAALRIDTPACHFFNFRYATPPWKDT